MNGDEPVADLRAPRRRGQSSRRSCSRVSCPSPEWRPDTALGPLRAIVAELERATTGALVATGIVTGAANAGGAVVATYATTGAPRGGTAASGRTGANGTCVARSAGVGTSRARVTPIEATGAAGCATNMPFAKANAVEPATKTAEIPDAAVTVRVRFMCGLP